MIYVDTSAAVKRVFAEAGSETVRSVLQDAADAGEVMVSSFLLRVELTRFVRREALGLVWVERGLSGFALAPVSEAVVDAACAIERNIRSLDAVHLATAQILNSSEDPVRILTFDNAMRTAAEELGFALV